METIERLFRRFRQVDTTDTSSNGSSIQAVSATNQLLVIRERLQAGLSARLLELKTEMDKEFGTAFVDMESYLRTEKGARESRSIGHNSWGYLLLFSGAFTWSPLVFASEMLLVFVRWRPRTRPLFFVLCALTGRGGRNEGGQRGLVSCDGADIRRQFLFFLLRRVLL